MTKIIFIHIPKTGGSSLNGLLRRKGISVKDHNIRDPNFKYLKQIPREESEIRFCIVRNPFDRVVSAFFYLSKGGNCKEDLEDAKNYNILKYKGDFELFVKNEFYDNSPIFEQIHFKEQYKWICDDDGNLLVDEVLSFENLKDNVKYFLKKNKINTWSWRFPHRNKSKHSHYSSYYTEETKKIIAKVYETDFKLFHYSSEKLI